MTKTNTTKISNPRRREDFPGSTFAWVQFPLHVQLLFDKKTLDPPPCKYTDYLGD